MLPFKAHITHAHQTSCASIKWYTLPKYIACLSEKNEARLCVCLHTSTKIRDPRSLSGRSRCSLWPPPLTSPGWYGAHLAWPGSRPYLRSFVSDLCAVRMLRSGEASGPLFRSKSTLWARIGSIPCGIKPFWENSDVFPDDFSSQHIENTAYFCLDFHRNVQIP